MTKASPLSGGTALKNSSSASTPPAEAPMPTIGRFGANFSTAGCYIIINSKLTTNTPSYTIYFPGTIETGRRFLYHRVREARMTRPPIDAVSLRRDVLEKARDLAQQVRQTAERVHQQALEAHRLTEIARRQSDRGRELSRAGREEARSVKASIGWGLEAALATERRLSGKGKN